MGERVATRRAFFHRARARPGEGQRDGKPAWIGGVEVVHARAADAAAGDAVAAAGAQEDLEGGGARAGQPVVEVRAARGSDAEERIRSSPAVGGLARLQVHHHPVRVEAVIGHHEGRIAGRGREELAVAAVAHEEAVAAVAEAGEHVVERRAAR